MSKIEEIYDMLQQHESKEEIRQGWENIFDFERKSKINLNDDKVFFSLVDYEEYCKLKGFEKGFRFAVQLMKECGL